MSRQLPPIIGGTGGSGSCVYQRVVGEHSLPDYGPVGSANRRCELVLSLSKETRKVGGVGSCALQAHEIQPPKMAAAVKLSQQLRTESCVVVGNGHCEA